MKILVYSIALAALSVSIIYLFWFAADRPNKQRNHFERKFINSAVGTIQIANFKENVKEIIGATSDTIFFSTEGLGRVLLTDKGLKKVGEMRFSIPKNLSDSINHNFFSRFDAPWIYFCAYNIPAVIRCNIYTRIVDVYYKPGTAFTSVCPVSDNKYLFRQLDYNSKDQIFSMRDIRYRPPVNEQILYTPYGDGGLISSGSLHYEKEAALFTYTFVYGNKILLFDTSLSIINIKHTIDTFSLPLLKTGKLAKNTYSNLGPSKRINHLTCMNKTFLFVNSLVKADNEDERLFDDNAVIDVYDLKGIQYKGSFYIPKLKHKYISRMFVVDKLLIVFYKQEIVIRSLDFLNK